MVIPGRVQNGVVVFTGPLPLPEGSAVIVSPCATPGPQVAKQPKRVEFPLVRSSAPGSVQLTGEQIGEIMAQEDIEALKGQWNAPS